MSKFVVTIPTRDRPNLFRKALDSVLAQSFSDYEVVVIDDGSKPKHRAGLEEIKREVGDHVRWIHLERREKGHGHPFARNTAAASSTADYICTLDDDDTWIDTDYLKHLNDIISSPGPAVDAVFSNQLAYRNDRLLEGTLWLDKLKSNLEASGRKPDRNCAYTIGLLDLLAPSVGFCHLNNLVLRRGIYESLDGLDETLRYEPDRDIFLRVIDASETMLYLPDYISRHNVPDQKKADNVSTQVNILQKRLIQLRVLNKSILFSRHSALRDQSFRRKAHLLQGISEEMLKLGRRRDALRYAMEAFGAKPGLKWGAFVCYLALANLFYKDVD